MIVVEPTSVMLPWSSPAAFPLLKQPCGREGLLPFEAWVRGSADDDGDEEDEELGDEEDLSISQPAADEDSSFDDFDDEFDDDFEEEEDDPDWDHPDDGDGEPPPGKSSGRKK